MKYVTRGEIALLAGVSASAVSNWLARELNFPKPVIVSISGKCQLWDVEVIQAWLLSRPDDSRRTDRSWMKEYL